MYEFSVTYDGTNTQKIYDPTQTANKVVPGFRVRPVLAEGAGPADVQAAYVGLQVQIQISIPVAPGQDPPRGPFSIEPDGPHWYQIEGGADPVLTGGVLGQEYIFEIAQQSGDEVFPSQSYADGFTPSGGGGSGSVKVITAQDTGLALDSSSAPGSTTAGAPLASASGINITLQAPVGQTIVGQGELYAWKQLQGSTTWVRCPDLDLVLPTSEGGYTTAENQIQFGDMSVLVPAGRLAYVPKGLALSGGTAVSIEYQITVPA